MKKAVVIIGTLLIVGLIVFSLFKHKAEMTQKSKIIPIDSFPVKVVTTQKRNLNHDFSQVGVIVANNDISVVSELQGKVTKVYVQQGSYISAGSPIVRVENDVPRSKLISAQTSYEKARRDWEHANQLYKEGLVSNDDLASNRLAYKTAETNYVQAQHDFNNSLITSPISGVVASRPVDLGTMLSTGTVVADVVDTSKFKVNLDISERYAFQLKVGDPVTVQTDVYPGTTFSGQVKSISVKGSTAHTYPVEILITGNNRQFPLKSGMFGTVSFNLPCNNALVIPRTALLGSLKTPQVYVVKHNKAVLQNLVVGPEIETNIIVLQGLNQGDQVVVSGQDSLKDGASVRVGTGNQNPFASGERRKDRHHFGFPGKKR